MFVVLPVLDLSIEESWNEILKDEFEKEYFKNILTLITRQKDTIAPRTKNIFNWSITTINNLKVVIIGQDPYHTFVNNEPIANGLCFSVSNGVQIPPSLQNIYLEIKQNYDNFIIPKHGNLSQWAEQGVLLLNSVLTVKKNEPNSHKDKGWEKLTDYIIKYINSNCRNIVFMLWGSYAKKKGSIINKNKHLVLEAGHPSPYSAGSGFFGCKHFIKCNEFLKEKNIVTINWNL